jgi:transcription initiation factor TFIIE subunit beta
MSKSLNGSGVPSPSPSNASASAGQKRKRPANALTAVQIERDRQPRSSVEILTQVRQAETYLQERGREATFDDIINFLSIQRGEQGSLDIFRQILSRNGPADKITYNPHGAKGKGTFKYRSIYPVHNAEDLRGFLQKRTHAIGVRVDELKDGWKDCVPELDKMEQNGELLVVRDKNRRPKTVWQDDKTLSHVVDENLMKMWHALRVPSEIEEIRIKLMSANITPSSAAKKAVIQKAKDKKRKGARRGGRQTNVHMTGVLKDYSGGRA